MIDDQLHPWKKLGEPVLKEMLIPRPMPDDSVGHLGLELWTYAAMMAPAHLRSLGEPRLHFQKLNNEWLAEISDLENHLGPDATLEELEAGEAQIRLQRPWATPELAHPIWDGTSDDVELDMEMAPELVLSTLEQYRQLRHKPIPEIVSAIGMERLEVAVMLLEDNGKEILAQISQSVLRSEPSGRPTSSGD